MSKHISSFKPISSSLKIQCRSGSISAIFYLSMLGLAACGGGGGGSGSTKTGPVTYDSRPTVRPFAAQQYDFIQAQTAISIDNSFSMIQYAPRYRVVLSHNHLFGDIAPYHELSVANSLALSLTPNYSSA